jgi:hypothetical protein
LAGPGVVLVTAVPPARPLRRGGGMGFETIVRGPLMWVGTWRVRQALLRGSVDRRKPSTYEPLPTSRP